MGLQENTSAPNSLAESCTSPRPRPISFDSRRASTPIAVSRPDQRPTPLWTLRRDVHDGAIASLLSWEEAIALPGLARAFSIHCMAIHVHVPLALVTNVAAPSSGSFLTFRNRAYILPARSHVKLVGNTSSGHIPFHMAT